MSQKQLTTFLDGSQRTIIAEFVSDENNILRVCNPVVVNIVQQIDPISNQPTGQMALQLLPLFFKEFLGDKSTKLFFDYNKQNTTHIKFEGGFDFRLYGQYDNMFNPVNLAIPQHAGQVVQQKSLKEPINLFSEPGE